MKPVIPKVLLLRERSACTGRARPTPPRKDWRGVGPGSGIERAQMYASARGRKRGKKEGTFVDEREDIYIKTDWDRECTQLLHRSNLGSTSEFFFT
jgi:hypothetical protein